MNRTKLTALTIVIWVALATLGLATDTQETAPAPATTPHIAVFKVPDLTTDLAKQLVKGLAKVDGVIAAKPDIEAGTLAVTFTPATIEVKAITKTLSEVVPDTTLETIAPADTTAHTKKDCGKCPHQKGCSKKQS
jgi:hypothetical protein